MKSRMAGVLNLCFSIFKGFLLSAPFFRGLRRQDSGNNEEKSFTKLWALDCWFSRTKSSAFFALKKGTEIGGMIVCFGLCPCQHNGTYTRNVYPATPTKKPAQILRFAESKNEPLSRKILGKAAQKALGKGTGPSNLAKSILVFFVTPLKMGAKKPGSRSVSLHRDTNCHPG